ncbi:hypothetical protein [Clostridium sp. C2-6-12]|uniref:hypothetical protein n=1 Tax=Clostridium sp. C2-6-12 TaxID=2698832 RepID=UPI00136C4D40|nr:hypothetical protein [Clostridium sp. C2-6-12]
MIDTLKNILYISISNKINFLIYYFKRLPLIGKVLKDTAYKEVKLKKIIAILVLIIKAGRGFIGPIAYVGLAIYLPIFFFYKGFDIEDKYSVFSFMIFVMSFLIGGIMNTNIMVSSKEKFICVKLLKMKARDYGLSMIFSQTLWSFVCFLPTLIVVNLLLGKTVFHGILMAVLIIMFKFFGEAFQLLVFEKKNLILAKKYIFIIVYCLLMLIAAYVPVFFKLVIPMDRVLFNPFVVLIIIILGIASIKYILNYKLYYRAFNQVNKLGDLLKDQYALNEAQFADVQINEKEFNNSELNSERFNKKEGYEYLNAIFFNRHKKLLYKPMYIELVIIGIIFLLGVASVFIFPSIMQEIINDMYKAIPGFLLIMYFISNSRRVTKAMFYNCDISLLRYGFYRDRKVILKNFQVRLLKVAFINLIPAAAICASIGIIVVIVNLDKFVSILPMLFMILILSLFFSVHDLFLYYIMQPYTTELNIKNPYFGIVNGVVFWICYLSSKIKTPPTYFVGIVLTTTIVYIIVALFSVYKFAPKTFKVK